MNLTVHIKTHKMSSFKAVTRKQPFLCRTGDPARDAYIFVYVKDDGQIKETRSEAAQRFAGLVSKGNWMTTDVELCALCAEELPKGDENTKGR